MTRAAGPETHPVEEELTDRIGKINDEIEKFDARVNIWGADRDSRFANVGTELAEDRDMVVAAVRRVGVVARDEWRQTAESVRTSVAQLEHEIETARADLEVELADDVDAFRAAAEGQVTSWKGYLDLLRLRAKLASMDARDALETLESAYRAAQPELEGARTAANAAFAALRDSTRNTVIHLRQAARDATTPRG